MELLNNLKILEKKNYIKVINSLFKKLFPITRSITGNGVRKTFKILKDVTDLNIHEFKSGSKVFDWEISKKGTFYNKIKSHK